MKNKKFVKEIPVIVHQEKKVDENKYILFTFLFALFASLTMYFHEMWRDEYQAWLISSFSVSLTDLYSNIHYEGHPAGWFTLLFFISRVTSDPVAMQIIHLAIAIVSAFLTLRYSPFSILEKLLLVTGYFFLYEYCVISRNYAISVLLIILICIQFQKPKIKSILTGVLLFLLCNTNLYGGMMAAIFAFFIFSKMIVNRNNKKEIAELCVPLLFTLAGLYFLYIQVRPASLILANDYYKWKEGFSLQRILTIGSEFFDVYFPLPPMHVKNSFGINIINGSEFIKTILAAGTFGITCWYIKKEKLLLATFITGTLAYIIVLYFNQHTSLRHEGFLFILYIIIIWLYRRSIFNQSKSQNTFKKVFITILIIQSAGGLIASGKDILNPFSNLTSAGKYAISQGFDSLSISGMADYIVSPLTAFTRKPIYVAETKREEYFIIWDDKRIENNSNLFSLLNHADSIVKNKSGRTVIVLSQALRNADGIINSAPISPTSKFTLIKTFDKPTIVGDENYYFYEITN